MCVCSAICVSLCQMLLRYLVCWRAPPQRSNLSVLIPLSPPQWSSQPRTTSLCPKQVSDLSDFLSEERSVWFCSGSLFVMWCVVSFHPITNHSDFIDSARVLGLYSRITLNTNKVCGRQDFFFYVYVFYAYQGCVCLIKNRVILWNIIQFNITVFHVIIF